MSETAQLPQAIERFLHEYVRQRNRLLFLRGLLLLVVVGVGWLVLCSLADRVLHMSATTRGVVLVATVGSLGLWLVVLLRCTLLAKPQLTDAAMELELIRPDLDQRLATVCSRLRDNRQEMASPEMLEAIACQIEACIGQSGTPRLVSLKTLGRHAICLGILLLSIVMISMLPLLGMPQLLKRTLVPWTGTPPVTTSRLLPLYDQRNIDVLEGHGIVINVLADRIGSRGVVLSYTTDGKTWDRRPMVSVGPHQYQGVFPATGSEHRFSISSGDAQTQVTSVTVLRKPAVAEFRIRYEYPQYMKREPFTATNTDGLIEAPAGTKATVTVVATERISAAVLDAKDFSLPLAATVEPAVVEGSFTITRDQPYQVRLVSAKGLSGSGPEGSQVRAIPDRTPFVQIVVPGDDLRLSPRDITSVRYQAIDDYGVVGMAMRLQVNNAQPIEVPLRFREGDDSRRREGDEELDLANLGLRVGDVVAVTLLARDGAGQSGDSETRYLFVSPHSVGSDDYARMSELQRSLEATRELGKEVESAIQAMDRTRSQRSQPQKLAESAASYQQHIADSGQQAEVLRRALSRAIARSQDPKLNDLLANMADRAQVRMVEAHDLIDELGQGDAREENARQRLQRSLDQTRQMQQQLETLVAGEHATAALADRRNLKAAEEARATGKMTARAVEMLERMRQDVADQTRQLGLNPDAPNLEDQLKWKGNAAAEVAKQGKDVDLTEAAQSWADQLLDEKVHPPMFDRRLSAAADVESVRRDADLQRAADLNLASRAAQAIWLMSQDAQSRSVADRARREFVKAFGDIEKQHDRSQPPMADEPRQVTEARRKLSQFAGETESAPGPANVPPDGSRMRDLAMEANAEMVNRRYDRASELQRRMMLEQQQAMEAADALREAQQVDELAQVQDTLRRELQASQAEAAALEQRQREVARRIAVQMGEGENAVQGLPRDTRREALAAIQAVQERLAQMPQQLQEATGSADVQFQAHDLTQRLAKEAETVAPDRKPVAERAVDRARIAEADAVKQTDASLSLVDPDVAKVMSASLSDFAPETDAATGVLDNKLTPALEKVRQGAADNKAPDLVRGVRQAREAIAQAQQELRKAQAALLDRDPLFAARVYAEQAAQALAKRPPDVEGAKSSQQMASQALNKQWSQSVHDAAVMHLAASSQFQSIYSQESPQAGKQGESGDLAAVRQWGTLRARAPSDISAATHEDDPGGYQRMLQIYFRTLGKAKEGEKH